MRPTIAVLVPCRDEAAAVADVVRGFRAALPDATVYVYDNASTDATAEVALLAGAVVRHDPLPGKGNVVRRMFADVDADVFVLVDGDGTYDASAAPAMVARLLDESLDLVTGVRVGSSPRSYRRGHRLGNRLLTGLVAHLFGNRCSDMLSGYRVMSRRLVKSFPALSHGFEIETELTVHALQLRVPIAEAATAYRERAADSSSKLRTFRDGFRIGSTIVRLVKEERPLYFFGLVAALLAAGSLAAGAPVIAEFAATGLVPRLPTVVLAASLMLLACMSTMCGLILDTVTRGRLEIKRLSYLSIPAEAPRIVRGDEAAAVRSSSPRRLRAAPGV